MDRLGDTESLAEPGWFWGGLEGPWTTVLPVYLLLLLDCCFIRPDTNTV